MEWSDFFLRTIPSKGPESLTLAHFVTSSLGCFLLGRSLVNLGIGEPQKFWTSMMLMSIQLMEEETKIYSSSDRILLKHMIFHILKIYY